MAGINLHDIPMSTFLKYFNETNVDEYSMTEVKMVIKSKGCVTNGNNHATMAFSKNDSTGNTLFGVCIPENVYIASSKTELQAGTSQYCAIINMMIPTEICVSGLGSSYNDYGVSSSIYDISNIDTMTDGMISYLGYSRYGQFHSYYPITGVFEYSYTYDGIVHVSTVYGQLGLMSAESDGMEIWPTEENTAENYIDDILSNNATHIYVRGLLDDKVHSVEISEKKTTITAGVAEYSITNGPAIYDPVGMIYSYSYTNDKLEQSNLATGITAEMRLTAILVNTMMTTQEITDSGDLVYKDRFGFRTIAASNASTLSKHAAAIRAAYYNIGKNELELTKILEPNTLGYITKGTNKEFKYYEKYVKDIYCFKKDVGATASTERITANMLSLANRSLERINNSSLNDDGSDDDNYILSRETYANMFDLMNSSSIKEFDIYYSSTSNLWKTLANNPSATTDDLNLDEKFMVNASENELAKILDTEPVLVHPYTQTCHLIDESKVSNAYANAMARLQQNKSASNGSGNNGRAFVGGENGDEKLSPDIPDIAQNSVTNSIIYNSYGDFGKIEASNAYSRSRNGYKIDYNSTISNIFASFTTLTEYSQSNVTKITNGTSILGHGDSLKMAVKTTTSSRTKICYLLTCKVYSRFTDSPYIFVPILIEDDMESLTDGRIGLYSFSCDTVQYGIYRSGSSYYAKHVTTSEEVELYSRNEMSQNFGISISSEYQNVYFLKFDIYDISSTSLLDGDSGFGILSATSTEGKYVIGPYKTDLEYSGVTNCSDFMGSSPVAAFKASDYTDISYRGEGSDPYVYVSRFMAAADIANNAAGVGYYAANVNGTTHYYVRESIFELTDYNTGIERVTDYYSEDGNEDLSNVQFETMLWNVSLKRMTNIMDRYYLIRGELVNEGTYYSARKRALANIITAMIDLPEIGTTDTMLENISKVGTDSVYRMNEYANGIRYICNNDIGKAYDILNLKSMDLTGMGAIFRRIVIGKTEEEEKVSVNNSMSSFKDAAEEKISNISAYKKLLSYRENPTRISMYNKALYEAYGENAGNSFTGTEYVNQDLIPTVNSKGKLAYSREPDYSSNTITKDYFVDYISSAIYKYGQAEHVQKYMNESDYEDATNFVEDVTAIWTDSNSSFIDTFENIAKKMENAESSDITVSDQSLVPEKRVYTTHCDDEIDELLADLLEVEDAEEKSWHIL